MPIALRTDFDADTCRLASKGSKDGPQARRRLSLAAIDEGASRGEAARIGGVTVQIVRDWVVKFNRVFDSYDKLVDHRCEAWSRLIDQPWEIMSIGMRDWAHRF